LKNKLIKYFPLLFCLTFFSSLIIYYNTISNNNFENSAKKFQKTFTELEYKIDELLDSASNLIYKNKLKEIEKLEIPDLFFYHVYRNDSLVLWNTNQVSVGRFVDIHFPYNGLLKLQNGWYYSKAEKVRNHIVSFTFLIKQNFEFKNEFLNNEFNPVFKHSEIKEITLDKSTGFPIYNKRNLFQFSILHQEKNILSHFQSSILFAFWIVSFSVFCYCIAFYFKKFYLIILLFSYLVLILSFHYDVLSFLEYQFYFFDPKLYGYSVVIPNFFSLINLTIIVTVLLMFIKNSENKKPYFFLYFFYFNLIFAYILFFIKTIFTDSTIPLSMYGVFKLNFNSFIVLIVLGLLCFNFFQFTLSYFRKYIQEKTTLQRFFIFFFAGLFQLLIMLFLTIETWKVNFSFFLILILLVYYQENNVKFKNIKFVLFKLSLFSAFLMFNFYTYFENKELILSSIYADQLASEKDISTELEFNEVSSKFNDLSIFNKFINSKRPVRSKEFKDFFELTIFNGFWERFEIEYLLYDVSRNKTLITTNTDYRKVNIDEVIEKHSKVSEIDTNLFYVNDFTNQLSYISKNKIFNKDLLGIGYDFILYCVFKSKRIPEKIGFPRLLVSENTNVLSVIEDYSFAKYYNGNLVTQFGDFSYPQKLNSFNKAIVKKTNYSILEGFRHFTINNNNEVVILSKEDITIFNFFSTFSYLLCFNILLYLALYFIKHPKILLLNNSTLAFKIQIAFITIIIASLIALSFSAGLFVKNQYDDFSNKQILQKLNALKESFNFQNSNQEKITIEENGEELSNLCQKFASIFETDISLYDLNGYLISSSRSKIFDLGLISEQLNPNAFNDLKNNFSSNFIQNENIGNLFYLAAYTPLNNQNGQTIAYLNLQHFRKQTEFKEKIEQFIETILNIFILLLILSLIITIIISNWLTKPLKIIQESLISVQLGKYNEPIPYVSNDEIGELVKNYNQKLNELAFTANQLAINERESAWREMAKQVAHEIKNPLTPMKLSLQHFQRVFDPKDPQANIKLNQVIYSLIEQIDSLTKIANEFSNFAKLPKEQLEKIDVMPIILNVITIFQQEKEVEIIFNSKVENAYIKGDKNLLLQVFNNLITNSIQAANFNKIKIISIEIDSNESKLEISITDNGIGIPLELQSKIFEPNFTTKSSGSGLGLALVKQIVNSHDGEISFSTKINSYTKFTILFPILND
jgi:two-component system, NtrC family, nitrogen regulation sensor histidine kinase NtrY